jgi:GNAT superfamily N-acetyltransferase
MLATWWRNDPLPELRPLDGLDIQSAGEPIAFANFDIPVTEAARRITDGHRPYIASYRGQPAAYGWVATLAADIGELDLAFEVPSNERYLWDFKTRPEFRGLGIYPRLLNAIIRQESRTADRLWILASPENTSSNTGIARAGFRDAGTVRFTEKGTPALGLRGAGTRALAAAAFLGVALNAKPARPCWACEAGIGCGCTRSGGPCTCGIPLESRVVSQAQGVA